jgi:hypothetical protein
MAIQSNCAPVGKPVVVRCSGRSMRAEIKRFAPQITTNAINGLRGADIRCGNVRYLTKADNRIEF